MYLAPKGLMDLSITDSKLDGIDQVDSPNKGGALAPPKCQFLVAHYTAGPSLKGTIDRFKDPKSQVSAHLVIDRDGRIVQTVPFNRAAWHAGVSSWKKLKGLNAYSIGIEMVNAGWLKRSEGGNFFTWWGSKIEDSNDVLEVDPKALGSFGRHYWHAFPEAQISAFVEIAQFLIGQYGLQDVLGHSDIAPGRKTDPGPAFPMDNIRSALFGRK